MTGSGDSEEGERGRGKEKGREVSFAYQLAIT